MSCGCWRPTAARPPWRCKTVERAMEVAGGAGFYRGLGLERLFRDVQGARYHHVREPAQVLYAGRLALGLDVNG
ncbi:MAG: hypothetical protein DME01_12155 [Candidatus Rokuibacteriota bacterium]|nr:MAG: hypothetical protein DME01_12155 [Candidatus Rokubacteria bacterium]